MTDAPTTLLPALRPHRLPAGRSPTAPPLVTAAGPAAAYAWEEFLTRHARNPETRRSYTRAVRRFLAWCGDRDIPLAEVRPLHVSDYLDSLPVAPPSKKLHLAALRALFDALVTRHAVPVNPAASVRGERHSALEGKTPEITIEQAKRLLASVDTRTVVGLRDKCVIAVLVYTAARAGAVARLRVRDVVDDGSQRLLRFAEKGGKERLIPVRHDLEELLVAYRAAAGLTDAAGESPLFRTATGKVGRLTENPLTGLDVWRIVKRRLKAAGLPGRLRPHSFRVLAVTDLLSQNVPLEDVQMLAGHADPRTTRLYDRRQRKVTRNIVERISV
ncbi:MAG: integrase [Isosphaera sp.]|nr:integrase [Isosphaera sp.]